MSLTFRNNVLSGYLSGAYVHGLTRPVGGGSPPPGVYNISGPINDPIYGMVAILTPAGGASSRGAGLSYMKMASMDLRATLVFDKSSMVVPSGALQPLVLSDRQIAGRNCIVVTIGFADLMSALEASGGGQITIA